MKILIVNAYDISGGAARAATRLHHALLSEDVDSQMLVIDKQSDDYRVTHYPQTFGRVRNRLRNIQLRFSDQPKNYSKKTKTLFSSAFLKFSSIVDKINAIRPDIVHLHWICNEMILIEDLKKIKAPIVWSLHDMWAFTGGCHYDEGCGRYTDSCGICKVLGSSVENDLSKRVFNRKQGTFEQIKNMTIIGLSSWLSTCARSSSLFRFNRVLNIPNPINCQLFRPLDRDCARKVFSLPTDKQLILFGAMDATDDPRKGFHILIESINRIKNPMVELVVFGSNKPKTSLDLKFKTHFLGQLNDDVSLRALYSACNVMVVPSLQENLSNAIMESLSCGTPVVGFSIGGNGDLIDHHQNGYLATPFDSEDLANGIDWILNTENYGALCKSAREKVLIEFDAPIIAKKYKNLYEEILS